MKLNRDICTYIYENRIECKEGGGTFWKMRKSEINWNDFWLLLNVRMYVTIYRCNIRRKWLGLLLRCKWQKRKALRDENSWKTPSFLLWSFGVRRINRYIFLIQVVVVLHVVFVVDLVVLSCLTRWCSTVDVYR